MTDDGSLTGFNGALGGLISGTIAGGTDPERMADVLEGHARVLRHMHEYENSRETADPTEEFVEDRDTEKGEERATDTPDQ